MQIITIQKRFKALECKFEPFERDSKHLYANSIHSNQIWSIQMHIRTIRKEFECKF